MRFFIDGTEWNFPHMDSLTREELLEELRGQAAAEGRVIVDMLCDGEALDDKAFMTVPDAIDVEVRTASPWGLGIEILDEIDASLSQVFCRIQEALDGTQMFDPGQLREAHEQLAWIGDVIEGFRDAYPEYEAVLPDATPLEEGLSVFEGLLSDGRYADANEWHEREWKGEVLPPFVNGLKELREWFAEQERRDGGENEREGTTNESA